MNRLSLPLCAVAALLSLPCCKTSSPDPTPPTPANPLVLLPAETQVGANTFGCLINGKAYLTPFSTLANGNWISTTMLSVSGQLYENGSYTSDYYPISLVMGGNLTPNVFNLIPITKPNTVFTAGTNQFFTKAVAPNGCYYSGTYIRKGQVVLSRFDGVARIASGRFAFTLYELGGCDSLEVTNGRFDVKF